MMATLGGCGDGYELPSYRIKSAVIPGWCVSTKPGMTARIATETDILNLPLDSGISLRSYALACFARRANLPRLASLI
jgi:hypothetical protein